MTWCKGKSLDFMPMNVFLESPERIEFVNVLLHEHFISILLVKTATGSHFPIIASRTSLSIRLKGEDCGDSSHEDVQGGADVDWYWSASLRSCQ
jgi:hypothetical protein